MITDPSVFKDDHFATLKHREGKLSELLRAWEPAASGDTAADVMLFGPQGVGKTLLARHGLQRIQHEADVDSAHVGCLGLSTAGILREVLCQLPGEDPYPTMPKEDLDLTLRERVDEPVIVVLDEADDLPEQNALDRLCEVPKLSVVIVCHERARWLSRVSGDVRHRLTGQEIGLDKYGTEELADILYARAREGLEYGAVDRDTLERLADIAGGVARTGIFRLHASAALAERRRHETIQPPDVDQSAALANRWMLENNLASLGLHHHILYELIRRSDGLSSSALHDRYTAVADTVYEGEELTPVNQSTRRAKLRKLREYDLVTYTGGENRHGEYLAADSDVKSELDIALPASIEV
ncbi:AAA family ATPase [Halomicroarcula sp. S1AR25-4]|uniref:Cdc6/Cdc18 family protein n=1 Tax=Haloarcula sp. S1AR25-4 TaxID=2950538 RepID=UPI00287406FF|nr:AAA family ATPase [Halomicroarcula sp. S1AR25-4]MDS0280007.1 AAA family ATPase [Halomicroarcula sp. S1AR25-4]